MDLVLLCTAVGTGSPAVAWMVVQLHNSHALKQMFFKSIEGVPPETRVVIIKALGEMASRMSRERPPGGLGNAIAARARRKQP